MPFIYRKHLSVIFSALPYIKERESLSWLKDAFMLYYYSLKGYRPFCLFRGSIDALIDELDEQVDSLSFSLENQTFLQSAIGAIEKAEWKPLLMKLLFLGRSQAAKPEIPPYWRRSARFLSRVPWKPYTKCFCHPRLWKEVVENKDTKQRPAKRQERRVPPHLLFRWIKSRHSTCVNDLPKERKRGYFSKGTLGALQTIYRAVQ